MSGRTSETRLQAQRSGRPTLYRKIETSAQISTAEDEEAVNEGNREGEGKVSLRSGLIISPKSKRKKKLMSESHELKNTCESIIIDFFFLVFFFT